MLKAKKNLRIYPANNPMYLKVVEETYKKFNEFLEYSDELSLRISRNDIYVGGESVYQGEGKDDNLALFFFRDGLRALVFEKGLEMDELRGFLQIISVDFDSEMVEDDVVTLLWERDFRKIRYTVDEAVLVEEQGYEEEATRQAMEGAMEEKSLQSAHEEALHLADMEVAPHMPITEDDLRALAHEIQKDSADKMSKLLDILFNMLYLADSIEEFKDVARILNNSVEYSIRHGSLKDAAAIFRRTKEIIDRSSSEEMKKALGTVLSHASSPSVVRFVGELIDSKEGLDEKHFRQYVSVLGPGAIGPFMELLGELKTISGRKNAIIALSYLGKMDVSRVVRGLKDDRWYVVRNVVHILRNIGDRKVIGHLLPVVGHEDPRVRKEVVKTLGQLGGQQAAQTVQGMLDDPDKTVRSAAIRALGSTGTEYAKAVVIERVSDRGILNVDFHEMKEYFDVLSRWRQQDVFEFLMDILRKNPFFGRAKFSEYKACAVHCLGIFGSKAALEELEKLRDSKHRLLSEYVATAIKRIESAG